MKNKLEIKNQQSVLLMDIPVLDYAVFYDEVIQLLASEQNHCLVYYAFLNNDKLHFICAIGDDEKKTINVFSHIQNKDVKRLNSITEHCFAMQIFEREIAENWGVDFEGHPWLKPVRYAFNRADKNKGISNYPFYKIGGNELHEVGVGPIHAGIIEPGHFRFLCNGETVLHLEIQRGWQHRGIENLFLEKKKIIQGTLLAEGITGDTTIGHNLAFTYLMESLGKLEVDSRLDFKRAIALEMERIAVHVGDLSAMCTDVAYQLGSAAFGALRTPIINFTQAWCGNRFGKGLVRVGGTHYPLTKELAQQLYVVLDDFEWRFKEIADRTFTLPSILKRFESIGTVTKKQVELFGGVGMVAKMSGIKRDVRYSHPFGAFEVNKHEPILQPTGDVFARGMVRRLEIEQSIIFIRNLLNQLDTKPTSSKPTLQKDFKMIPNSFTISLTEGWRGEICHAAVTNEKGELQHYKVKDPSMHNWKSLELSLRDLEISDFPINNKSYDLSYCGHDL